MFLLKQPTTASKTYFYQRRDGTVFAAEMKEASGIHSQYQQWGVSDGTAYRQVLQKAYETQNKVLEELDLLQYVGLKDDERELFDEAVAKVKKVKAKRLKLLAMEVANKKALSDAYEAEKTKAKGSFETPPDLRYVDINGKVTTAQSVGMIAI